MAKLNLDVEQAIEKIKTMISFLEQLKTTTGRVSQANATNIKLLNDELTKLNNTNKVVKSSFELLQDSYAKALDTAKSLAIEHGKSSSQARKAASGATYLANKLKKLDDIGKSTIKTNKERAVLKEKLRKAHLREADAIDRNKKALDRQRQSALKSKPALFSLTTTAKNLIGAFGVMSGVQIFANILQDSFKLIKSFDSIDFAMAKITQTSFDLGVSQRFLIELSRDFGVELEATSKRWTRFLASAKQSGITLLDTQDIFRSMTKAGSVLGLQTDELSSIFLALEQMLSKGKVTTEELRRQLGERLPGAMGIMAASMGVTISKLDEMMKKGQVLSAEVLPDFARAVEVAYGIENLDKVETLTAAQNRLTASWQLFVKYITEDNRFLEGVFDGLRKNVEAMINYFGTMEQKRGILTIGYAKQIKKEEFQIAKDRWNLMQETGNKFEDLTDRVKAAQKEQNDSMLASGSKGAKILQKNLDEAISKQTKAAMEIRKLEKENAEWSIDLTREAYEAKKKELEDLQKELEFDPNDPVELNPLKWIADSYDEDKPANKIDKVNKELAKLEAQLEYFRLLKEDSNVNIRVETEDGAAANRKFIDYIAPETVKWYRMIIKHNNELIENSKDAGFNYQRQQENIAYLKEIDRLLNVIDLDKINEGLDPDDFVDDIEILKQGIIDLALKMGLTQEQAEEVLKDYLDTYGATVDGFLDLADLLDKRQKMSDELRVESYKLMAEALGSISDGIFEKRIQNIEKEIEATEEYYDKQIELATNNEDEQKRLEQEKEVRLKELKKKKEKEEKKAFIVQQGIAAATILIQGAMAAAAAQAPPPIGLGPVLGATLLPLIGLNTGLQLAAVAAQTIPAFKDGVEDLPGDTKALINDGGVQEYVKRGDKLLTTSTRNAIVDLKKGDTVFKDKSDVINSSYYMDRLAKIGMQASLENEKGRPIEIILDERLGDLTRDVKKGIRQGLTGVNFHNHIKLDLTYENYKNNTL